MSVSIPTASLYQLLRLSPVDFSGGLGTRLRSGLDHSNQPVSGIANTLLQLLHRFQCEVYYTFYRLLVRQLEPETAMKAALLLRDGTCSWSVSSWCGRG